MKKKSYISTKFIILIPVFILGFVSVVSNILAVTNIKRVNANATQIANGYMSCISELGDIQKETLLIHRLGLSHIVATDLNTMISLVETIRSEQETLETYLDDFQEYVTDDNKAEYDALVSNYEGMKYELANLMAYSANNDNEAAYALANGKIADYSSAMQESIAAIRTNVSENADVAKEQLAAVYRTAIAASTASIIISVAALLATLICVFQLVIIPLLKTQKEITDIIEDIDKREGDLTRRVSVHANQEVAAVGNGINVFMDKLQDIFKVIVNNSTRMESVVGEVRDSVVTSNGSVSDLSALTEELSATMEDEPLATVVQNMRKGSKWLSAFLESYRPPLDGERYLTDREVAELLRVSRRTLQEYRNNRVLPFILLGGKVLYPESGLRELLEANYRKPME